MFRDRRMNSFSLKRIYSYQSLLQIFLFLSTATFKKIIILFHYCCELVLTQKKLPSTSLVKMAQGTFIEAQITNMEIICHAHMEGRWYTGRKLHQISADWAVHARCYLQKGVTFHFNICDFGFLKDRLSHFYQ